MKFYFVLLLFVKMDVYGYFVKKVYGLWMMLVFWLFVKVKFLCGMVFDLFGCIVECCIECVLIGEYEVLIGEVFVKLNVVNWLFVFEFVVLLDGICGYGYVKENNLCVVC